jgi:putative NADH-flavin reductase
MTLLVFGATGGTGRALVEQALDQGHIVTAFARDPAKIRTRHRNLKVVKGNIFDYESVQAAINGHDAVMSALGVGTKWGVIVAVVIICLAFAKKVVLIRPLAWFVQVVVPILAILIASRKRPVLSEGTRNIIQAMKRLGVKRFICESSLGVGDSKGQLGFFYNWVLIPLLLRNIFADKEVQERMIKDSDLDWVIVRPALLTNGPRTGKYRSGFSATDKSIRRKISRADVADFMLRQISEDVYLSKTPGISY